MKIIIKKRKSNWCSFEHLTKKDNWVLTEDNIDKNWYLED